LKIRVLTTISLLLVLVLTIFDVAPVATAANNGNGKTTLNGNVAPWLSEATLTGHSDPNGRVSFSMYLNLNNESALQTFIHNLYTPGTKEYGHFITPAQFHALYSPSQSSLQAVKDFLSANQLKVAYNPANGMFVDASGTVAQIEKAFGITENQYNYNGKNLRANVQPPTVPSSLGSIVNFIGGLDESEALIAPYIRNGESSPPGVGYATPGPCSTYWNDHDATVAPAAYQYGSTLPWVPCGYTPPQIRSAYGVDKTGLTGAGVRIGITDAFASPTIVQDVNLFSSHYGLPLLDSSNFQQVVVPGTYNFPENHFDPQGWYGEESLDVDWVHAMAPAATIVYAGGQNSNQPLDHALIHLIDSNSVDIITNSWGITGEFTNQYGHIQADEKAFMQAAAQGISVLFSSGDDGDVASSRGVAMGSWPATSPWVTAVGGTSLALKNASGSKSEWGWGTYRSTLQQAAISPNDYPLNFPGSYPTSHFTVAGTAWSPWPPAYLYGSGGGISFTFAQPDYQKGVVPDNLATSTTTLNGQTITFSSAHRVVPDISMVGDPNTGVLYGETYVISGDASVDAGCIKLTNQTEYCERRIGGTSLSSPLFAGVLALAVQSKGSRVGFVNPALYHLGLGSGSIVDVLPPAAPTAALRNTGGSTSPGTTLRTMNSVPVGTTGQVIEGADSSLRTTNGWDNVTGLGTPYVPLLVQILSR
jgi:subtilase family serine protease